jgi:hypothetical protein
MADIQIIIGYETVTQADQAFKILDKTVKSTARQYEQAFSKITSWQKKFSNEQNKVNATLNSNHLAQQRSIKSARESARAFEDAARATEKEAGALHKVRMATDSVYRNQQKRLQMKKLLKSAIVAETMTTEQAIVALKKYNAAQMLSSKVTQQTARKTNQLGVMMQQTGYQVGDFAVQVGSGQNVMVAFGQQATQLVGTMAMFAKTTKMIALFSGLGIVIPILTGIGAAMMRTSGSSKSLSDTVSDLETSTDNLFSSLGTLDIGDLGLKFGDLAEDIKKVEAAMVALEGASALNNLSTVIGKLGDQATAAWYTQALEGALNLYRLVDPSDQSGRGSGFAGMKTGEDVDKDKFNKLGLGMEIGQFEGYLKSLEEFTANGNMEGVVSTFGDMFEAAKGGADSITLSGMELLRNLRSSVMATAEMTAEMNGSAAAAKDKARADELSYRVYQNQIKQKFSDEEQLMSMSVSIHKDTQAKIDDRNELSSRIYQNQIKHRFRGEEQLMGMSVSIHKDTQDRIDDRNKVSSRVYQNQIKHRFRGEEQLMGMSVQIHNKAEREKAIATEAAERAATLADAERLLGEQMATKARLAALALFNADLLATSKTLDAVFRSRTLYYSLKFTGDETVMSQGFDGPTKTKMSYAELKAAGLSDDQIKAMGVNIPKSRGGGGTKPREQLAEYLEVKQQELDLETQLVGIFGAEREIQTELFNTKNQYSDIITGKQEDELEGILRLIQAERERQEVVEEASAKQQSIADTLQSSMSTAFMSMVDGTKSFSDAMKDMARSVIKQLFDILVVQKLVGSFDSKAGKGSGIVGAIMGAFQADGGVWAGGSQVQAYANGGVVNGPTNFPMSGNKMGLMGEAGPEAIMPLKRGSNGKLGVQMEGGGGGDVIHISQSFNFQANGDETVKKLIAQAAPKIAQMTKSSMLDDRRRGGVTKAAFG